MKMTHRIAQWLALLALCTLNPQLSSVFAQAGSYTNWNSLTNWTQTSAPGTNWSSIASSADGTELAATVDGGGIYTSTNSGVTWTRTSAPSSIFFYFPYPSSIPLDWYSIASSGDGTKLAATAGSVSALESIAGQVYTSSNSGVTWSLGQEQSTGGGLPNWTSIASSADGTKMAAVESSAGICTSTNSGDTWAQTSAPSAAWSSIASSADGTQLAATVDGGVNDGGGIYTSTNSGGTWTQTSAPGSGPFDRVGWSSIASSADGTKLAAVVNNRGGIYTSTNSGGTWTQTSAPSTDWSSIASSADGIKLAAVVLSGGIYTSTDSGVTWNQTSAPGAGWLSIASSADGTRLAAVVDGGGIWTAQATIQTTQTTPGLTITPSGGSIIVSWPYPSSGFILQQNDDLSTTNWTASSFTITTNASVNSSTIIAPTGNLFFRLSR